MSDTGMPLSAQRRPFPSAHGMMKPTTVLLDMDGVLAEVSASYRQAIIQTTKAFGATVTDADVDVEKKRGNANNDWVLSQRLIKAATGKDVSLEMVTAKFEELYQGTATVPGLCTSETLVPPVAILKELHRRSPGGMAIVTGRPRKDCDKFLNDHNIAYLFKACVCMEDGPPKPSPEPFKQAAQKLGVSPQSCLIVGDTPDDIRSAVSAGGVGVGIITPTDFASALCAKKEPKMTDSLLASGASCVLRPGLADLLDILPSSDDSDSAPRPAKKVKTSPAMAGRRYGAVSRATKETAIDVTIDLDGTGKSDVDSGIGFLDHMLTALSKHSRFDITLKCKGDIHIDDHHSAEDCALALGEAFDKAVGDRAGIARYGTALCPLDEALSRCVVDISSRPFCHADLKLTREMIGALSCEMIPHVFESFAQMARVTLHVDVLKGFNDHHKAESAFKAMAVALRTAVARDATAGIPSTKGVLA